MIDPLYTLALGTGLFGSGHCIGMCGGLVAALSLSAEGRRGGIVFHLLYNAGRIATYTLIGILVGWLGSAITYTDIFSGVTRIILVASDLFVIAVGLGSAGLFSRFNVLKLEFGGPMQAAGVAIGHLRRLPPALAALPLGLVMGLLPCGFLYAMAITAAQSASPVTGGAILLAFGLGTVPALFFFGSATHWIGNRARSWMVRCAGVMVALMGALNLLRHLRMMGLW
jgi:hypothetical protein